jgi:hypothetical protein
MQRIRITRDSSNNVQFETVSVDNTENVFFINLDSLEPHWPTIASNQLGPSPSAPSSQCQPYPNLDPADCPIQVTYQCQIVGHTNEQGIINIFAQLAAGTTTLSPAVSGQPIAKQQVVVGGLSPYQISGQLFEITGPGGVVLQSGSGIGPGLQLTPSTNNSGVSVSGTPTVSGTYNFTFTVDDAMEENLQQVQYTMVVT